MLHKLGEKGLIPAKPLIVGAVPNVARSFGPLPIREQFGIGLAHSALRKIKFESLRIGVPKFSPL
jgi:hypothetical protein